MNNLTKIILIACTVILFAGLGALTASFPDFQKNISEATSAKPENFTELYFENHLQLPQSVAQGQPQTFSFTVHNLENKTMTYPYEIFVQDAAGSRSGIVKSEVTLRHNQQKIITESFEILESIKRAKVVVNLINKNQEIHFWIGEDNK